MKLKPCPFCGGEAEVERLGTKRASMIIVCSQCGCCLESGDVSGFADDKHLQWNMRYEEFPTRDSLFSAMANDKEAHHPGCFPDGDDTSACHPDCPVRKAKEDDVDV